MKKNLVADVMIVSVSLRLSARSHFVHLYFLTGPRSDSQQHPVHVCNSSHGGGVSDPPSEAEKLIFLEQQLVSPSPRLTHILAPLQKHKHALYLCPQRLFHLSPLA